MQHLSSICKNEDDTTQRRWSARPRPPFPTPAVATGSFRPFKYFKRVCCGAITGVLDKHQLVHHSGSAGPSRCRTLLSSSVLQARNNIYTMNIQTPTPPSQLNEAHNQHLFCGSFTCLMFQQEKTWLQLITAGLRCSRSCSGPRKTHGSIMRSGAASSSWNRPQNQSTRAKPNT